MNIKQLAQQTEMSVYLTPLTPTEQAQIQEMDLGSDIEKLLATLQLRNQAYISFNRDALSAFLNKNVVSKASTKDVSTVVYPQFIAKLQHNKLFTKKFEADKQPTVYFCKAIWSNLTPEQQQQNVQIFRQFKKFKKTAKKVEAKTEATTSIVKPQPQLEPPATDQQQIDQPFFDVIEKCKNADLSKKNEILENLPTDFAKKNAKKIVAILFHDHPKDEAWTHFSKVFPKNKKSYLPITNAEILAVTKQHPELAHEFEQIDEKAVIESWFANQKSKQTQNLALTKETSQ